MGCRALGSLACLQIRKGVEMPPHPVQTTDDRSSIHLARLYENVRTRDISQVSFSGATICRPYWRTAKSLTYQATTLMLAQGEQRLDLHFVGNEGKPIKMCSLRWFLCTHTYQELFTPIVRLSIRRHTVSLLTCAVLWCLLDNDLAT